MSVNRLAINRWTQFTGRTVLTAFLSIGSTWPISRATARDDVRQADGQTIAAVLSDVHIVEAVVTEVKPRPDLSDTGGRAADVTLEVLKVYCGDGLRARDTFSALMADGAPGFLRKTRSLQIPEPVPKTGDIGLWQRRRMGHS